LLCIVPRPRGGDWLEDEIAAFARLGIEVVVSLLTADEQIELNLEGESAACVSHDIEFVSLPVPDLSVPIRADEFVAAVLRLLRLIHGGRSIAVHCRQSVGRSGLLTVSIVMAAGMPMESAIAFVSRARGVRVPETDEQRAWLRDQATALSPLLG